MKDVGNKPDSLRSARAQARFIAPPACIERIARRETEKGDPQDAARIAGILAAKRTDEILPLCHPLPIHAAEVYFSIASDHVVVQAEVHTIGPTGVEMEALTAAATAALTLYDMLKPYAEPEDLRIDDARLLTKTGGKSDHARRINHGAAANVLMIANPVADGHKPDTAGRHVVEALSSAGFDPVDYAILRDDPAAIEAAVRDAVTANAALITTVGGTGIGPNDCTVETINPMLTRPVPGLAEAVRGFGQKRTPAAAISRGVSGFIDDTLVLTLPGSRAGAAEAMAAVLPSIVHIIDVKHRFDRESG